MLVKALKKLRTGEFTGVRDLEKTGLSALQIDEMLVELQSRMCIVEGSPCHGWRLVAPIEWLDANEIRAHCAALNFHLEVLDETDSTQDEIERFAHLLDRFDLVAVCAEHQRAGRGRQGRAWTSAVGCDVLMSVAVALDRNLGDCAGASLALGVAMRDAIPQARLKWPNDIVSARGAKVGGILCEAKQAGGRVVVKVGIGINVRNPAGLDRSGREASSLEDIGFASGRNWASGAIISRVAQRMRQFARGGFASLRDDWRAGALARPGDRIGFRDAGGEIEHGIYRDVGEAGELVVETSGELRRIYSAEVDEADPLR